MTICPSSAGIQNSAYGPTVSAPHDGQTVPSALGGGRRPARLPDHVPGMGEAHRLARRHAQARLEAAARLERGTGNGRHLRAQDRKSTRLNSSHLVISYAVFCLKKKKKERTMETTEITM